MPRQPLKTRKIIRARKARPVAEIVERRDNLGYQVFHLRTCRLYPHVFTSRLAALDFANEITFHGFRTAAAALEARLRDSAAEKARSEAAARAAKREAEIAAGNTGSRCTFTPTKEHATREDIVSLYGERTYWQGEVIRLTRLCALPTSNTRNALHNRMMLMNATSMLADIDAA